MIFRHIIAIAKKEFVQLRRDSITMKMIILVPLIQLLMFGFAINTNPHNLPTAINLKDKSIFSRDIISGMKHSKYFNITKIIDSDSVGQKLLDQGLVTFVVTIPNNFSKSLILKKNPKILIEADATDPLAVLGALPKFDTIVKSSIKKDAKGELSLLRPEASLVVPHILYNPEELTKYNIVPGLIAIVLTMTSVIMTARSLTKERELSTMENLLSMPISAIELILGKISPYIIIGYMQAGIILIASKIIFGVPFLGSILLMCLALMIFIICNLALGFTISTIAENQMQAMQESIFILLPSILLSGFMFPFYGMPIWAQFIGNLLPSTYLIRLLRGIMLKGNTFYDVWQDIWPMIIFMVVVILLTIKAFKKTLD